MHYEYPHCNHKRVNDDDDDASSSDCRTVSVQTANKTFENNVAEIHAEIMGEYLLLSIHSLLTSQLLPKNAKTNL